MDNRKYKVERYKYSASLAKEVRESVKRKKLDNEFDKSTLIRFYLLVGLMFVISLVYVAFNSSLAYIRAFQACKDLINSIGYYLLIYVDSSLPYETTVNTIPSVSFESILPYTFEELRCIFSLFWDYFFTWNVFADFLSTLSVWLLLICQIGLILLMLLIIRLAVRATPQKKANANWNIKSKGLKRFLSFRKEKLIPLKNFFQKFWRWFRSHYFGEALIVIWAFNLNIATIIIEAVAFYFFLCRFKDLKVYIQFYKLVLDIGIFLNCSFLLLTVVIFIYAFNKWRHSVALKRLRRLEERILIFFRKLAICVLITATVGAGKTTLLTSLGLTGSLEFRNQALKRMYKYDKYFPNFPWLRFEKYLKLMIKRREITNLATIEDKFAELYEEFVKSPIPSSIYGYNISTERVFFYTGLRRVFIWEALETYAKLYFVYTMETSLIAANFSVREDYLVANAGNFIMYNGDFFTKEIDYSKSHFSHILDFDTLRIGVTMVKDSKVRNSFEFGMILITEFGKELGNQLENLYVKKTDTECNVKNDLFIKRGKYSRHPGTIDGYAFVRYIGDEQRAMSLGADFREMCDIIDISESEDERTTYPMFYVESLIYDFLDGRFFDRYYTRRMLRGDETLSSYSSKNITCAITNPILRTYNHYCYKELVVTVRRGDDEKTKQEYKVPVPFLKLYSDKFATDAHAQYFRKSARIANVSLNDFPVYKDLQATDEELHQLHSHAIKEMDVLGLTATSDEEKSS